MASVELVGVLNITPDSFSGDGTMDCAIALQRANAMFTHGASYIDVGAESTRYGATPLTPEQEWQRLKPMLPLLDELINAHPGRISIDTHHPEIVRRISGHIGSFIINDVTGFNDPDMVEIAAYLQLPCIISHLPEDTGTDIQLAHKKAREISYTVGQVRDELLNKRERLIAAGVNPGMIILDPGIGFGKTRRVSWQLLSFAAEVPGIDVMIGYSKKKFLGEQRGLPERNLEAGRIAVAAGARYLRVHGDLLAAHRELKS